MECSRTSLMEDMLKWSVQEHYLWKICFKCSGTLFMEDMFKGSVQEHH